jgi:hypothetical protein
MSLFNRVLEIKFSIFISTLTGIALVSSLITFIVVNSTKQPCPPCQKNYSQSKKQLIIPQAKQDRQYWIPSNNGRKF